MDAMQLDSASFHPAIMEMQPEFIHSQGIDDDFILPLLELSAEGVYCVRNSRPGECPKRF
jgi:hypothetical protein